ncbi:MAG TPA: MOSC domain-containing protein [Bryobacteraceae bacterium]|nr:MOSC domain-containing protein [Bryobacteraceae bacterium]
MPKVRVNEPVMLVASGIEGDRHRDLIHHGGPHKAVLMIASEILDDLKARGYPVYAGALGENLTVSGMDPHAWRGGQRYRIGEDAVIELTKLRTPCSNLFKYGRYIGDELYDAQCAAGDFSAPHWAHGGFYARVITPGLLVAGDSLLRLKS